MVDCTDGYLEPYNVGLSSDSAKSPPALRSVLSGPRMNSVSQLRGHCGIFFILWASGYVLIRKKGTDTRK